MRTACVLIHNLAIQLALKGDNGLTDQPLIISQSRGSNEFVYAASAKAMACGIREGIPLHEALACCPEAALLPAEERGYRETFEAALDVLDRFSRTVEVEKLGCAYLDVSGYFDEVSLAHQLLREIAAVTKLKATAATSGGKFFSWAAAFSARPEAPVIIPQGSESEFITPLPVDLLPCSESARDWLRLVGIHRIGDLARFSLDALTAQFGKEGAVLYQIAHGVDPRPLVVRKKPEVLSARAVLEPPAETYVEILAHATELIDRLVSQARVAEKVCCEIRARLISASGVALEKRLPLKKASLLRESLIARMGAWLERVRLPEAVDRVEISFIVEPDRGEQVPLWGGEKRRQHEVIRLTSELRKRLGHHVPMKIIREEPDALFPECRFRLTDLDQEG